MGWESRMGDVLKEQGDYTLRMDNLLSAFFRDALKICLNSPSLAWFVYRLFNRQKRASKLRGYWETQGIHVPPYMIASITNSCNLNCKGCYARAHHRAAGEELAAGQWAEIFNEAEELGISVIFLAGGEPLTRLDILDAAKDCREIVFPLFTNGTLLDDNMLQKFKKQKNLIPIISLEGFRDDTDERRGAGVYEHVRNIIKRIREKGIFYGISLTVTSKNFDTITGDVFIKGLVDSGCRLFMFVEYVAVEEGTEHLVLTDSQRLRLRDMMYELHKSYNRLFAAFPGDEEMFGGCLAAGRGFVHVSPNGSLEPCPFSPYSDTSLKSMSLKDALKSEFLKKIRQEHGMLTETKGGCALWNNRDWVKSMLNVSEE